MSDVLGCCGDIGSLEELVDSLNYEFADKGPGVVERVRNVMARYRGEPQEWGRFAMFDNFRYTRNLIAETKDYVLMLLCWGPHQHRLSFFFYCCYFLFCYRSDATVGTARFTIMPDPTVGCAFLRAIWKRACTTMWKM
jgi:hypothetical protein